MDERTLWKIWVYRKGTTAKIHRVKHNHSPVQRCRRWSRTSSVRSNPSSGVVRFDTRGRKRTKIKTMTRTTDVKTWHVCMV